MRIGFRQWGMGQGRLWPAGYAQGVPWDQQGPTRFRCVRQHCQGPSFGCQCGIYVRPHLRTIDRRTNNGRWQLIVGAVQAWGRYVLHGDRFFIEGGRFEMALPVAFVKPCTVLAQRELAAVAERLGAMVLADREALQEWADGAGPGLAPLGGRPWWEQL